MKCEHNLIHCSFCRIEYEVSNKIRNYVFRDFYKYPVIPKIKYHAQ